MWIFWLIHTQLLLANMFSNQIGSSYCSVMLSDFRPLVSGRAEIHYVLFARFCILHYAFIDIVIGRGSCQSIAKGFMYDISDRLTIGKPWRKKKTNKPHWHELSKVIYKLCDAWRVSYKTENQLLMYGNLFCTDQQWWWEKLSACRPLLSTLLPRWYGMKCGCDRTAQVRPPYIYIWRRKKKWFWRKTKMTNSQNMVWSNLWGVSALAQVDFVFFSFFFCCCCYFHL